MSSLKSYMGKCVGTATSVMIPATSEQKPAPFPSTMHGFQLESKLLLTEARLQSQGIYQFNFNFTSL